LEKSTECGYNFAIPIKKWLEADPLDVKRRRKSFRSRELCDKFVNMATLTLEKVTNLAEKLPLEEQLQLVEKLAQSLRHRVHTTANKPQNLYGSWKNAVPQDFDIDSALAEIRGDWQTEQKEMVD
jgi:Mg/Co/Ni transporter MgtE